MAGTTSSSPSQRRNSPACSSAIARAGPYSPSRSAMLRRTASSSSSTLITLAPSTSAIAGIDVARQGEVDEHARAGGHVAPRCTTTPGAEVELTITSARATAEARSSKATVSPPNAGREAGRRLAGAVGEDEAARRRES